MASTEMNDTFDADGALSRGFLLRRGYCCENGCRNCPYGFNKTVEDTSIQSTHLQQISKRLSDPE